MKQEFPLLLLLFILNIDLCLVLLNVEGVFLGLYSSPLLKWRLNAVQSLSGPAFVLKSAAWGV